VFEGGDNDNGNGVEECKGFGEDSLSF
jgi:hypothetical protein